MTLHFISHIIQVWLLPPGLNLLIGLCGFILYRFRYFFLAKLFISIAFVSLWLLSTPIFTWLLISPLQDKYPPIFSEQLTKKDAALVILGGGDSYSPEYPNKRNISTSTLARLAYGAYIHNQNLLPILVSGGSKNKALLTGADMMADTLDKSFNIAPVWQEESSLNTADESRFLLPFIQKKNIHTIYLITNAWHMPRAMYAFNASFKNSAIKIIPMPMGYFCLNAEEALLNWLPAADALLASTDAMHEYIGLIWYKVYQAW